MKKRLLPNKNAFAKKLFTPGNALLLLLALSILAYHYTQSVLFGFLAFAFIVAVFVLDLAPKKGGGAEDSLTELVLALAFAAAGWFLLGFLLNTASPMSVVVSCSMVPNLERGDLVFVQGGEIRVPTVIAEAGDEISVAHEQCAFGGLPASCSKAIVAGNRTIPLDKTGDILVLEPYPPIGDFLVHRAVLRLQTESGTVYLTKGDNNPIIDQEGSDGVIGNGKFYPVSPDKVKGRVVLRVPFVGYVKLLLFLQFAIPEGCGSVLEE